MNTCQWRLPSNTHNVIIQNLTYNIDDHLDARMAKLIHMCLNHDNEICRSISLSKLLCKNSTFASNYSYLSCKYNLSHHDWHLDTSHLIGKVRLKNKQKSCLIIIKALYYYYYCQLCCLIFGLIDVYFI